MRRHVIGLCCLVVLAIAFATEPLAAASPIAAPAEPAPAVRAQISETYAKLPLSFEVNAGQVAPEVDFLCRGAGMTLFLSGAEAVLSLRGGQQDAPVVVRMEPVGAAHPRGVGLQPQVTKTNYLLGNDPKKWHTDIPNYGQVRYADVYPGVDLIYRGNERRLEYDLVIAPGADPKQIRFALSGADAIDIDPQGGLILHTPAGDLEQPAPTVYQEGADGRERIEGRYALSASPDARHQDGPGGRHEVSFVVGRYDRARPLVIDPVILYSTYLGGSGFDSGAGIAVDSSGNAYVTGYTQSTNFPTTAGAFQTANAGSFDTFVTKLNAAGTALIYSTYLGGSGTDLGAGIAVDSSGNAYVTGATSSTNFPTTGGAFQTANAGGFYDAFVTKLNATGTALLYSTYLGGSGQDQGSGIAVDSSGNAYVTGFTPSLNFPTTPGAFETANAGGYDAFVTKLNATGTALTYSTYLGGGGLDQAFGIAVDSSGNAYVIGGTSSTNFPTTGGAFQTTSAGGSFDAFVTKLNATGTALTYSTYLGGSGQDQGNGIAIDSSGSAYVTGLTQSVDFPTTVGAAQTSNAGGYDVFVTKLNAAGAALTYSTYLGGSGTDLGAGIAVDGSGNAHVTGYTQSTNFPTTPGAFQTTNADSTNAFVTKLNAAGTAPVYSTYLGGSGGDQGAGIAVDSSGNAYVTGFTQSTNFPTTVGAFQTTSAGGGADAFVTKIGLLADLAITKTDGVTTATPGGSTTYTITASNAGPSNTPGSTVADTFPASLTCTWTCVGAGGGTCAASGSGNINDTVNLPSGGSVTYTASCTISAAATGTLSNTATVTAPAGVTDPTPGNNSATDSDTLSPSADLAITKTDGVTTATPGGSVTYTITASNAGPSNAPGSTVADTFPASLTCTWTCVGAGGGTCAASGSGNINDTVNLPSGGSVTYTASCSISAAATGTLSNTATVTAPAGVTDPTPGNNSATDSDTLSPSADLAITKTDGVTTATPGGSTTYTITASNAGPSNAPGSTVADTFPASLTCTWTCVGAGGGTCAASGSGNINDTVNLPSGGSVTYTASCTISAAATGTLSNTATVTAPAGVTDPTPGNNSATDSDTLSPSADLAITKTDGVTTATPGGSVTYTITASNAGPSNAPGSTVADTFPASLTCTWTCVGAGGGTCAASGSGNINDTVNLPSGGSVTYTASCTISAAATGTLSNTATVTAPAGVTDPTPGNNSATDSDTLSPSADLAITKTDGVTTATPGGSVTYTITASNAGPSNAPGSTVADTFPASLTCTWTCVGAGGGTCAASGSGNINNTVNLPSGGSVTYTASCTISAAATGTLSNTATVTAPAGVTDPTPGNNSATDSDTLSPSADLAITKTDGVTTATPGGSTTYTITASNAGPSNAPGSTVADTFPASLTCTWTCVGAGGGTCAASGSGNINDTVNLPSGGSVTYTASCTISAAATGTLSNTATVTAPAGVTDPTPGNNSATDSDTLSPSADLAITKTDGVTTATPGGSVTYTITASNAGPSNAPGSTVADTFPASLTCTWTCVGAGGGTCAASGSGNINNTVNLPSGGSVTYTASCTISAAATGTLSNTATVTAPAGVTDPTPGNNSATDSDTLSPSADLAITKTDGVTTATPGGSTTYTITASNAGPSNAPGAVVTDTFPASLTCTWTCVGAGGGTCTASGSGNIGDTVNLPSGGSVTYTASCTISAAATGTLSNTATVTAPAGVTDPTPGNNSATDSDTLAASADLAITKTDGVTTATPGGSVTYTITASNAGPSNAPGSTVADTFPASLTCTWTCVGAGGGTCAASGSGNINNTVNLPSGGSVTYTASCTISAAATGTLSNTATVTAPAGVTDPTPGNNSATDSDTLTPSADLGITKTDGVTTATPGTSTVYTIVVTNSGPSAVTGATVADTAPVGCTSFTWTSVAAGGASGNTASGSGTIGDSLTLPVSSSVTYTATCAISPSATGTLSNTATITPPKGVSDPGPNPNSATDTDSLVALVAPTFAKAFNPSNVVVGQPTTMTFTVSNPNGTPLTGLAFSDTFPAGLQVAATPNVNNGCVFTTGLPSAGATSLSLSGGAVGPNTSCVFSVSVVATAAGNLQNNASPLTSNEAPASAAPATATLAAAATIAAVPTLSELGLALVALLLGAVAVWRLRAG